MTDNPFRSALEAEREFFSNELARYLYDIRERAQEDYRAGNYPPKVTGRAERNAEDDATQGASF